MSLAICAVNNVSQDSFKDLLAHITHTHTQSTLGLFMSLVQ